MAFSFGGVMRLGLLLSLTLVSSCLGDCSSIGGGKMRGGGMRHGGMLGGMRSPVGGAPSLPDVDYVFGAVDTATAFSAIQTWSNAGSVSGDATQATLAKRPMGMPKIGTPSVSFDGVTDCMKVTSSDTGLQFIHETGTFDIAIRFRIKHQVAAQVVMENANSATQLGFYLRTDTSRRFGMRIFDGTSPSMVVDYTSTLTYTNGQWMTLRIKGTGARLEVQKDWGTAENSSTFGAFGSGVAAATLAIGGRYDCGASYGEIDYQYVVIKSSAFSTTEVAALQAYDSYYADSATRSIAWIGDSLTQSGSGMTSYTVPQVLQNALGISVSNQGISGGTTANMLTRWTNSIRTKGYTDVILMGAVNSLKVDVTGASCWTDHKQIIDEANADGLNTIFATMPPWKQYTALWTAGRQTETDAYLSAAAAYTANFDGYADVYTALEDPGALDSMLAAYRHTDNLHVNDTGGTLIATTVEAVMP